MRRSLVLIISIVIVALPTTSHAVAPINDNFADAIALSEPLTATASASTVDATEELDEPVPSCIDNGEFGASVWYKYTPSVDVSAGVDTVFSGTGYDTVLAIYTGAALDSLNEIACNDEISSNPATFGFSRAAAILEGGITYHIQASGFEGNTGDLNLRLTKRRTTPAVVRGDKWFLNMGFNGESEFSFNFGSGNDDPLAGPFLGFLFGQTGVSAPTVRAGNVWFMNDWFDGSSFVARAYGRSSDFPVAGDRDGDGGFDIGVRRSNTWHFDTDFDGVTDETFAYGLSTDYPLMGDWDGDGDFTPGIRRGNKWFLNNNTDANADVVITYGSSTDFPIVGDWNGDGIWTIGVVRGNNWLLTNSTGPNASLVFAYGSASDFPLVGDWDIVVEE